MSKSKKYEFIRHAIVGIGSPDGARSAKEMVVRRTVEGEFEITAVPGTERTLPLTKEEAEGWVKEIPDMPEDVRESQIRMLCCED
jgi:hypothetical protein